MKQPTPALPHSCLGPRRQGTMAVELQVSCGDGGTAGAGAWVAREKRAETPGCRAWASPPGTAVGRLALRRSGRKFLP